MVIAKKKFQTQQLANEGGFTLPELILVGGLTGLLCLTVAAVLKIMMYSSRTAVLNTTRTSLMIELRRDAGDLTILRNLLHKPENRALLFCVCGTGPCQGGQANPLSLYAPGDTSPLSNLKYYDASGIPCAANASNCALQVSTSFVAQCKPTLPASDPLPAAVCLGPSEFVGVFFSVGPIGNAVTTFGTIQGAAFTQVADLAAPTAGPVCP